MKINNIADLYDDIFDVSFFIRYGYYDIKMKKIESENIEDEDLEEEYGMQDSFYLKIFNLQDLYYLSDFLDFRDYFNFRNLRENLNTEPIYFNIPKNNYVRREYKMPNIYSYLLLAFYIFDNKEEFISVFKENKQSTSKFFNQLDFDYKFGKQVEQRLLFGGNKILSLDLSSFYHTLYTHSIPWVINGKETSKNNKIDGFGNELDALIQRCQYGETHGIPVGNLLSRIIAELYMCHIDLKLFNKGYIYSRYVDDIKFPFSTEAEKEKFLTEFTTICRDYNLILNDRKTEVLEFPILNSMDKTDIFNFFDDFTVDKKPEKWQQKLTDFIDYCISEEAKGNKGALKCIFSVVSNTLKKIKPTEHIINSIFLSRSVPSNFNIIEKFIDVSLKDSRLTNKFLEFIETLIELGLNKKKLKNIMNNYFQETKNLYIAKLENNISNGWNNEVYQLLLYSVIFDNDNLIQKKQLITIFESNMDDFSIVLSIILWLKKKYKISELLNILENKLDEVHGHYCDEKSVRMQEKYWLVRYFVYYLIDQNIINSIEIGEHFKKFPKNRSGIVKSELNKKYILMCDNSKKKTVQNLNAFYKLLLDNNVALVKLGDSKKLFSYL